MPEEEDKDEDRKPGRPRPFWSGTITFGLVSLPVSLFVANRSSRVSLRMVDQDGTPLSRRYFCPKHETALSADEIVRGYEVEKDRFVVVEDDELDALAPEKSQEIDLRRFVDQAEIDPTYFERAYFLTPDKRATKAYRLLAKSMEQAGRAGIATFVMRGKEYLVAIIAEKGILRAETLRFHDELRTPEDVGLPEPARAQADRVREFRQAIDTLSADRLDRSELSDRQSLRILEHVREKLAAGEDVVAPPEEPEEEEAPQGADVVDLMETLKRRLQQDEDEDEREPAGDGRADGQAQDLAELSRDELYERAKALDIPGRSSMNKRQLAEAIGDAR